MAWYGFILIYIDLNCFCMDLYGFELIRIGLYGYCVDVC